MPSAGFPLALLSVGCLLGAENPQPRVAPDYSAAGIVNAADSQSGALAPNTIGTVYGANLACSTAAIQGGVLPSFLGTATCETQVIINDLPADLYYVSPIQINFLVPPTLFAGPAVVKVFIDGQYGRSIPITLSATAPGLFQLSPGTCPLPKIIDAQCAVATLPDGTTVLTPSFPAKPGDIVILYATGLGDTDPQAVYGQLPTAAAPLVADLSILLDGVTVPAGAIDYAGVAPGFAGLYQINLTLPTSTGPNPEIRLQVQGAVSIPKVYLPVMVN
jgi:uncharacterized protein (TIGR03437 family)